MRHETDEFLADYKAYTEETVKPVAEQVRQVLNLWRREDYWKDYVEANEAYPTPIADKKTRIKRSESVADKYIRLPDEFPEGETPASLRKLRDLLGARVVTYFQSQIRLVDAEVRSNKHFLIADGFQPRSYIPKKIMKRIGLDVSQFDCRGRKPNGYSSLHYFLRLTKSNFSGLPENVDADTSLIFELQVRTMSDDLWSEIEHQLAYKTERETEFSVTRQFRVIGDHLAAIDSHLDFLYDQLTYHQENAEPKPNDLLNAENMPAVLATIGFRPSQGQISKMLEILALSDVDTVEQFRSIANTANVEGLIAEYKRQAGKGIRTFEMVSLLGMIAEHGYSHRKAVARSIARNENTHNVLRRSSG